MIDPATSWFEIKHVHFREAHTAASIVEKTCHTRSPWSTIVVFDKGTEFKGDFTQIFAKDYGIEWKGMTVIIPNPMQ
jgi:hypothetical protein